MRYFILYAVNDPRSLSSGLNLAEASTIDEADRVANEARAMGCSGVRIIQGVELGPERFDSPLRTVNLDGILARSLIGERKTRHAPESQQWSFTGKTFRVILSSVTVGNNERGDMAEKNQVGQHGRKLKPNTTNWAVPVEPLLAREMIQLHDKWAAALGITVDTNKNQVTRRLAMQGGDGPMPWGISMPVWLIEQIEGTEAGGLSDGMVAQYQRKKYEIAKWALARGIAKLSLEALQTAYSNSQPSFSLVGLLALTLGLKDFGKAFAPTPGRESQKGQKGQKDKEKKAVLVKQPTKVEVTTA